jgi:acyl-CoA thioester hydrolase
MPSELDPNPDLPPPQAFTHRFVVDHADIDELGHANNVVWVRWVNEAAIAHSRAVGLGPDAYLALGVLWVVRRHEVDYLVSALAGEELEALTWVATLRGATSLRRTVIRRRNDRGLLARAATTWALIDMETGRPRRIPKEIMARYGFSAS